MVKVDHKIDREGCNQEFLSSELEMENPYGTLNTSSLSQHSGFKRSVKLQSVLFRMRELAETDVGIEGRDPSPFDIRSLTDVHPRSSFQAITNPELELRDGWDGAEMLDSHDRMNIEKRGVERLQRVLSVTPDPREHDFSLRTNEQPIHSSGYTTTRVDDASAVETVPREEQIRLRIQEAVRNQIYSTAAPSPSRILRKGDTSLVRERTLEEDFNGSHAMMRKGSNSKPVRQPKFNLESHVHLDNRSTQNLVSPIAAEQSEPRQSTLNMDNFTNDTHKREASFSRGEAAVEFSPSHPMRQFNIPRLGVTVEGKITDAGVSIGGSLVSSSGEESTASSSSDMSSIDATRSLCSDGDETATRCSNLAADDAECESDMSSMDATLSHGPDGDETITRRSNQGEDRREGTRGAPPIGATRSCGSMEYEMAAKDSNQAADIAEEKAGSGRNRNAPVGEEGTGFVSSLMKQLMLNQAFGGSYDRVKGRMVYPADHRDGYVNADADKEQMRSKATECALPSEATIGNNASCTARNREGTTPFVRESVKSTSCTRGIFETQDKAGTKSASGGAKAQIGSKDVVDGESSTQKVAPNGFDAEQKTSSEETGAESAEPWFSQNTSLAPVTISDKEKTSTSSVSCGICLFPGGGIPRQPEGQEFEHENKTATVENASVPEYADAVSAVDNLPSNRPRGCGKLLLFLRDEERESQYPTSKDSTHSWANISTIPSRPREEEFSTLNEALVAIEQGQHDSWDGVSTLCSMPIQSKIQSTSKLVGTHRVPIEIVTNQEDKRGYSFTVADEKFSSDSIVDDSGVSTWHGTKKSGATNMSGCDDAESVDAAVLSNTRDGPDKETKTPGAWYECNPKAQGFPTIPFDDQSGISLSYSVGTTDMDKNTTLTDDPPVSNSVNATTAKWLTLEAIAQIPTNDGEVQEGSISSMPKGRHASDSLKAGTRCLTPIASDENESQQGAISPTPKDSHSSDSENIATGKRESAQAIPPTASDDNELQHFSISSTTCRNKAEESKDLSRVPFSRCFPSNASRANVESEFAQTNAVRKEDESSFITDRLSEDEAAASQPDSNKDLAAKDNSGNDTTKRSQAGSDANTLSVGIMLAPPGQCLDSSLDKYSAESPQKSPVAQSSSPEGTQSASRKRNKMSSVAMKKVPESTHQEELVARIKEFQERRAQRMNSQSYSHVVDTIRNAQNPSSVSVLESNHATQAKISADLIGGTPREPRKDWPELPRVSAPITGKKVAQSYLQALNQSNVFFKNRSCGSEEVVINYKKDKTNDGSKFSAPVARGILDNDKAITLAAHSVDSKSMSKSLRRSHGGAKPATSVLNPLADSLTQTTILTESAHLSRLESDLRSDQGSSYTRGTNTSQGTQTANQAGAHSRQTKTKQPRSLSALLSDSPPTVWGDNEGEPLHVDRLVSRIDRVVHKLLKSGKLAIMGAEVEQGSVLGRRQLQKNTAELLRNLAVLRSRRSASSQPGKETERGNGSETKPGENQRLVPQISVGNGGYHVGGLHSGGHPTIEANMLRDEIGAAAYHTGTKLPVLYAENAANVSAELHSEGVCPIIKSTNGGEDSGTAAYASGMIPLSSKKANLVLLREKRDNAARRIIYETQKLSAIAKERTPPKDIATETTPVKAVAKEGTPIKSGRPLSAGIGKQCSLSRSLIEKAIPSNTKHNQADGMVNMGREFCELKKRRDPPRPERYRSHGRSQHTGNGASKDVRSPHADPSKVRRVGEIETASNLGFLSQTSKVNRDPTYRREESQYSLSSQMLNWEREQLQKLPMILTSATSGSNMQLDITDNSSSGTYSSEFGSECGSDDSGRLERIENMIQELRERRSHGK